MIGPSTGVLGAGLSFTTITLVNVTLPVLVTVPVKVSVPPAVTGCGGQALVIAMPAEVRMGQVELALLVTTIPQVLVALTLEVLVASPLAGAV